MRCQLCRGERRGLRQPYFTCDVMENCREIRPGRGAVVILAKVEYTVRSLGMLKPISGTLLAGPIISIAARPRTLG